MRTYTPRRAGKRWLAGAPEYILDVFDNKGKTCDRYTVLFGGSLLLGDGTLSGTRIPCLHMSEAPTHPQGCSMWGEISAHEAVSCRYRFGHTRIRWMNLPEHIRQHVIARATEE